MRVGGEIFLVKFIEIANFFVCVEKQRKNICTRIYRLKPEGYH